MSFIVQQIARPLVRRAGSLLAGYLAAAGVAGGTVATIEAGAVAFGLVAIELIYAKYDREKAVKNGD